MDIETLAARLEEAADLHAIANLKSHYCWLLDTGRTVEAAGLFTEDGVFDGGGQFGRHEGREAVGAYFTRIQQTGLPFVLHGVLTPFIERRTPTTAFGRWYLYMPCTMRDAAGVETAMWGAAWYEDDFLKGADGVWRICEVRVTSHFWAPATKGWVE